MVKRTNAFKKFTATLLMAALTASMVTGCGTEKQEQSNETESQTNTSENSSVEDSGEAEELSAAEKWGIDEFTFVLIPGEDSEKSVQLRDNMCEDLSEAIGIPVNVYRATDYNAAVEAMRTGNAQLAFLGPFSYVTAVERAGAECICVSGTNGSVGYQSYIITKGDSDIESLENLEGTTFGFVDPSSTSGNVVPCNEILENLDLSISFDDLHLDGVFFKTATYVGNHQNSIQAVIQGNVDAAAVSSNTLSNQIEKGNIAEDDVKIIHESPVIPGSPICIQKDLPEELKEIVSDFLLSYDNDEYFGGPDTRYVAIEDSEYDYIRELQDKYGLTD